MFGNYLATAMLSPVPTPAIGYVGQHAAPRFDYCPTSLTHRQMSEPDIEKDDDGDGPFYRGFSGPSI
ncbi:MAG: hypothetical protein O3A85_09015 [Proteobacteria bacterium]|nr:hypothetical protein [Pseudomonadota bacterium]